MKTETKTFDFYLDRKMTIWEREKSTIQAESLEEAKKKLLEIWGDNGYGFSEAIDDGRVEFEEREMLWDTCEDLPISQNNNRPTVELFLEDVLIKNNAE
jgi:hypothetical protein